VTVRNWAFTMLTGVEPPDAISDLVYERPLKPDQLDVLTAARGCILASSFHPTKLLDQDPKGRAGVVGVPAYTCGHGGPAGTRHVESACFAATANGRDSEEPSPGMFHRRAARTLDITARIVSLTTSGVEGAGDMPRLLRERLAGEGTPPAVGEGNACRGQSCEDGKGQRDESSSSGTTDEHGRVSFLPPRSIPEVWLHGRTVGRHGG
jgi:hypothetical protein